jgi:ubiquinone/menaquinone biosynthesis C-methylase UbiE
MLRMLIEMRLSVALAALIALTGCDGRAKQADRDTIATEFPAASRPVSQINSSRWSSEIERDKVQEADKVMDVAGVMPGMTVADIGAGEGYYTIRLAARVGEKGRVLAQDIIPVVRDTLADRVYRERLDNVSVKLGAAADPKLPADSFDRVFMIHMFHEISAPYEFLWRLRPALRPGGRVVIVDADRPTGAHGIPPAQLKCELAALGYAQVDVQPMPQKSVYLAVFEVKGARPEPQAIKVCKG